MTDESLPQRTAHWNERAATSAVFLVLGMGFGAWAAALPGIKADLGLGDREISLALLALAAASTVMTLSAGWITPRLGTGRATGLAAIAFAILASLPAWAGSLPLLVAFAALFGLANGLLDVSMNSHASDVERRWGAAIMSSFHGAFSLGGLVGAVIGGALLAMGLGPAGEMTVAGSLNLVLALLAFPALGRGVQPDAHEAGLAWPGRAAWGLCAIAFCCLMLEGAVADWSAIYLTTVARLSEAAAASGYAAFSVAMMAGRFAGDVVVRHLGRRAVVVGGTALALAGIALSAAVPEGVAATLGFLLVGLGLSNVVPVVFSAAARTGRTAAAGIAAVASCGYVGFIGGPPLIGAVADATSLRAAFGCMILIALAAVIAGLRSRWSTDPG